MTTFRPPNHPWGVSDIVLLVTLVGFAFKVTEGDTLLFWQCLLASGVLMAAYRWIHRPYDFIRPPQPPRSNRGQKPSEFPPPYPNGWFFLCRSEDCEKGEVRGVEALGEHLVVVRNFEGQIGVLEAWCPHLGANLGVGGIINPSTNCLRCPFHGWEFDVFGVCTSVEGASSVPAGSNLRRFICKEANRGIYMWYDVEGREPTWELEVMPEVQSGKWYLSGRTVGMVHAHIQEIPENGADAAHLNVLHKQFVWEKISPSMTHAWTCDWAPHPNFSHRSAIELGQVFCLFGLKIPGTSIDARIEQHGPGVVKLLLSTPLGKLVAYEHVTPIKPTSQLVQHVMFCSPTIPRCIGRFTLWALEAQFSRDIPIWEAKKFLPKPKLSKADGPIAAFRRWYGQFYSPTSISFVDAIQKENMMDW